jgi:hypothetical protein
MIETKQRLVAEFEARQARRGEEASNLTVARRSREGKG